MCKHIYTKNNHFDNQGKPCSLYFVGDNINPYLPLDKNGICFFHSENEFFRDQHIFEDLFFKTLILLEKNNTVYDFSEIKLGNNIALENMGNKHFRERTIFLHELTFNAEIDFSNSFFYSSLVFSDISKAQHIYLLNVSAYSIKFKKCKFRTIDFSYSNISSTLIFENSKIKTLLFFQCFFEKKALTLMRDCTFKKAVGFYNSELFSITIDNSTFKDKLDFEQTNIYGNLDWENITLKKDLGILNCDIKPDLEYNPGGKAPISIKNIKCLENVRINLKGKKPFGLFHDKVDISFDEIDFKGIWHFSNVNLDYLTGTSKKKLYNLISNNVVNIGNGCKKYRNTIKKKILLNSENQNLAIELSMTYSNYFTNTNGIQLGVDIGTRTSEYVEITYFSDEDIAKDEFDKRLAYTEVNFWSIVGNNSNKKLTSNEIININDTLIDIMRTFFKLGSRKSTQKLKKEDLKSIFNNAIEFNDKSVIIIENVENIINRYDQKTLFSINSKQIIDIDNQG